MRSGGRQTAMRTQWGEDIGCQASQHCNAGPNAWSSPLGCRDTCAVAKLSSCLIAALVLDSVDNLIDWHTVCRKFSDGIAMGLKRHQYQWVVLLLSLE